MRSMNCLNSDETSSFLALVELEEEVDVPPVTGGESEAGNVHHEGELEGVHKVGLGEEGSDELGRVRHRPDGDGEEEALLSVNFTFEGGEAFSVLVFAGLAAHVEIVLIN